MLRVEMSNRKVKCRFCEQFAIQKNAFKVPLDNGKNDYYCNKEHYEMLEQFKRNKQEVLEMCSDIFDYDVSKDRFFLKELNDILKDADIDILKDILKENTIDIHMTLSSRAFATIIFKIKYFFAIVRKKAIEYKQQIKVENIEKLSSRNLEIYSYRYKPRKQKKTWIDIIKERNENV